MKFQTFSSSVRPLRVAVLTRADDPEWQTSCLAIIEYFTKLWGGEHSIIVPTNGTSIDDVFWMLLSAHDPDLILTYRKTGEDIRRNQPEKFDELVSRHMEQRSSTSPAALESEREEIVRGLSRTQADDFSISDELTKEILIRLAPFEFEGKLEGSFVHAGDDPAHPLTSAIDVVDQVEHSSEVVQIQNDCSIPSLWLAATMGWATPEHLHALNKKEISTTPVLASQHDEYELVRWGTRPWHDFYRRTPFEISQSGLNTVRSVRARVFQIPTVLVRGDSIQDFCLYYALRGLFGRAVWSPGWFLVDKDGLKSRMRSLINQAEGLGRSDQVKSLKILSASVSLSELNILLEWLSQFHPLLSISAEHLSPSYVATLVRHPLRVYAKGNAERLSTHPVVDDEVQGAFESPNPDVFKAVNPQQHRWIVEVEFTKHRLPRHPSLSTFIAQHPNLADVRIGKYGLAYLCPGALVSGADLEFNPLRPYIRVPSAIAVFQQALRYSGFDCSISDKGRYESRTIEKLGGIKRAGDTFRDSKRRALLDKFRDKCEPSKGVYDEGVYLKDERRYLNFAAVIKLLGSADAAVDLIDDFISEQIFYRGFILQCSECSNVAWFSVDEVTQFFTCRRCGKNQQYRKANWKIPDEPSRFYKLDEIVYQALSNNCVVPILTLAALEKNARDSFLFCPELRISPQGDKKHFMELDVCCIPDGELCIGEAKSNGSLATKDLSAAKVAAKYQELASKLSATRVVFSTSTTIWEALSDTAIDSAFASLPHIRVSKLVQSDL